MANIANRVNFSGKDNGVLILIYLHWWFYSTILYQDGLIFTQAFTKIVQDHDLRVELPDSAWYKVTGREEDDLYFYDLIIESTEEDIEIRYRVQSPEVAGLFPSLQFSTLLASLAANDESSYIGVKVLSSPYIQRRCHAEWASLASFTPKPTLSLKKHAKLLAFYHAEKGWVTTLVLFNDRYDLAQDRVWSLVFKNI